LSGAKNEIRQERQERGSGASIFLEGHLGSTDGGARNLIGMGMNRNGLVYRNSARKLWHKVAGFRAGIFAKHQELLPFSAIPF
jgi:hypothetical protein